MTSFDLIVLLVILVSTGFAAIRGGIREVGTIAALGGAGAAAFFLVRPIQAATGIGESFFATMLAGSLLAVVGFVGFYFLLHLGLKRIKLTARGQRIDRIAGGAFGFLRGLAIIGLGFLAYSYYLDQARRPASVANAATLPVAEGIAKFFDGFAPAETDLGADKSEEPAAPADAATEGYGRADRNALSEIVTTVTTTETDERAEPARNDRDGIAEILQESERQ